MRSDSLPRQVVLVEIINNDQHNNKVNDDTIDAGIRGEALQSTPNSHEPTM
jgi:hypothetical protein